MGEYKWRFPARIVACCHLALVIFSLLGIIFVMFAAFYLGRSSWSWIAKVVGIIYCFIFVALCYELHTSFVLLIYSTGTELDKEKALRKCKTWLITCITVLIFLSGSLLIISVRSEFLLMVWIAIFNAIIRGAFIVVVCLYVRELRSEGGGEQIDEFSELEVMENELN